MLATISLVLLPDFFLSPAAIELGRGSDIFVFENLGHHLQARAILQQFAGFVMAEAVRIAAAFDAGLARTAIDNLVQATVGQRFAVDLRENYGKLAEATPPPQGVQRFGGEIIQREIQRRGIAERELSRQAGLSYGAVHYIINHPDSQPKLETCIGLAKILALPESLLLQLAGHGTVPSRRR